MRKIVTRKAQGNATRIVKPNVLADDIYNILTVEVNKLGIKSRGPGLDAADIKALKELSQILMGLDKADRDRAKSDAIMGELQNLSKEELVEIVKSEIGESGE